jgi:hypothetical protein
MLQRKSLVATVLRAYGSFVDADVVDQAGEERGWIKISAGTDI